MKTWSQWLAFWAISLAMAMYIAGSSATMSPMTAARSVVQRADPPSHDNTHLVHSAKDSVGGDAGAKKADTDPSSKPTVNTPTATCGNGIVEKGEECDCGSDANCAKDPCCDRKTCKLTPGSVCSNSQSCCNKCQFRPSTFVCRTATPTCSLVQMCTGLAPTCPSARNTCHENEPRVLGNATAAGEPSSDESAGGPTLTEEEPLPERDQQCRARSTTTAPMIGACPEAQGLCQMYCLRQIISGLSVGNSTSDSPSTVPHTCESLPFMFDNGTPCGDGGTCSSGKCEGDKTAESFFQKNSKLLTILGVSIAAFLLLCCVGIIALRRWRRERKGAGYYYGGRRKKEKERKIDVFPMVQTTGHGKSRPRSNIRIGLDPMQPSEYYDHLSHRHQDPQPSGSRPPKYAPDALRSDQELREELEADGELGWIVAAGGRRGSEGPVQHQLQQPISPPRPSLHAAPSPLPSHVPLIPTTTSKPAPSDPPQSKTPPHSSGSGVALKTKEAIYTPPPLPSVDKRAGDGASSSSSSKRRSVSPYADEAMLVLPPASPPIQVVITPGRKNSHPNPTIPASHIITAPLTLDNHYISKAAVDDDDEPSLLQLNPSSLTVDESSRRQDRTSVSSFFSALQLDMSELASPNSLTPTSPTFSGGNNGMPLSPATALAIHLVTTPHHSSSSSSSAGVRYPTSSASSVSSQSTEPMDEHSDSTVSLSENTPASDPRPTGTSNLTGSAQPRPPKVVQGSTKPYQTSEYVIPTPVARRKTPQAHPPPPTHAPPQVPKTPPYPIVPLPSISRAPRPPAPSAHHVNPSPLNVRRHPQDHQHPSPKDLAGDLGFEMVDP